MKIRNLTKIGAASAALALLLTGCSGGGDDDGGGGGSASSSTAVLYSSGTEEAHENLANAARALDPSVRVDVVTGSSGPLFERIKAESATADVFWAGGGEQWVEVAEPYRTTEADAILEEAQDPEDRWTSTNQHVVAFMANVDQIDDGTAPTTWKELTDPKWAGKIIVADPSASTTALTALYGAYKVLGEDDFKKLAANLEVTDTTTNMYPAVAQGEYAVALAYEFNIYPYIEGGQPGIEMIYPEDGTFTDFASILLVKDAPHAEEGKRVIDTLLSKEVQEQNLVEAFLRPVRTDIDPSEFVDFKTLDELNVIDIHGEDDKQGKEGFLALWNTL